MDGKIKRTLIRVDLTKREINTEEIPNQVIKDFIGGRILGDYYLYNELKAGIDPLSPENIIMFSAGPLTGTTAPGCSRYILHTKSPLTGLYLNSLAGGYFGPELRKTGHEMIVVTGRADSPVYISVLDDEIKIVDAKRYWGLKTNDFHEMIKNDLKDHKTRMACIGPAGENQCLYASVISERRAAGRGGAGAVMGSKNLKAIVVRGTKKVPVAEADNFKKAAKKAFKEIGDHPVIGKLMPLYGSMVAIPNLIEGGITPWRNWQTAASKKGPKLYPQNWRDKYVVKDLVCAPPCNVKCSMLTLSKEGPYAGTLNEGPEYETNYAFGACCDIDDQEAIFEADALCDDYGLDTMSMGCTIAFAMECYEKGIINNSDTKGYELTFGNASVLSPLIRETAYKRGFGKILALGTKRMSEKFGQGSEDFAMHAKGMELGGYDPRGAKSTALVYACGPRGGCHKSAGSCNAQSLMELGMGEKRFDYEGKAEITKEARENRMLADSVLTCAFPFGAVSRETILEMINAVTGNRWHLDDLYSIAEKGSNIERAFNVREGLRRSWDTLPKRLLQEGLQTGPTKGSVVHLDKLLDDFYKLCHWDLETGIPNPEKLMDFGLKHISEDMKQCIEKESGD